MTIIIIAMIFVFVVLFVIFLSRIGKEARNAILLQKMVPVKFNVDNSKYGRRTAEPKNISVQTKTVKTTDVPVVVESDISPSPQIEQSNAPVVKDQKPKIGVCVMECHGKNAGILACTIVQKCSNGSLILNTLNGPIRKKKKYVSFN